MLRFDRKHQWARHLLYVLVHSLLLLPPTPGELTAAFLKTRRVETERFPALSLLPADPSFSRSSQTPGSLTEDAVKDLELCPASSSSSSGPLPTTPSFARPTRQPAPSLSRSSAPAATSFLHKADQSCSNSPHIALWHRPVPSVEQRDGISSARAP